jgi:hypothetical protein
VHYSVLWCIFVRYRAHTLHCTAAHPCSRRRIAAGTQFGPNIIHNNTLTLATLIISLDTLRIDTMMEEEAAVAEFFDQVQALASMEGDSFSYMEIQRMEAGNTLLLACEYN